MPGHAVEVDVIAATSLVNACEDGHAWNAAVSLLRWAGEADLQQDAYVRTAATAAVAKDSSGWRLATKMHHEGRDIASSSLPAWNACLSASAGSTVWRLALGCLQQLSQKRSLQKDVVSCSSALHACDMSSKWQHALLTFWNMQRFGPQPNVVAYGSAMSAASQAPAGGPWALAALKEMALNRIKPNVICMNAALSACAASFLWHECANLLLQMRRSSMKTTMVTIGTAMSLADKIGHWPVALGLLEDASHMALSPSLIAAATALSACKHEPTSWRLAVRNLAQQRQVATEAKTSSLWPPNLVMANALSAVCKVSGKWRQCTEILDALPTWRLQPDGLTFANVGEALAASHPNLWQMSWHLLRRLSGAELQPDAVLLQSALHVCEAAGSARNQTGAQRSPMILLSILQARAISMLAMQGKKHFAALHRVQDATGQL